MDLNTEMSAGALLVAFAQLLTGLFDLRRPKTKLPAAVLIICALVMFGFVFWLHKDDPLRPQIIATPCPPAKSGPATTQGDNSPANSGSGNTTTYSQPAGTQAAPPK
jgi:hypothetical protein